MQEEARAHKDGIDFYIHQRNLTIGVKRDWNGEVLVHKHPQIVHASNPIRTLQMMILIMVGSFILSILLHMVNNWRIQSCMMIFAIWGITFLYYFIRSRKKDDFQLFRYHGAEHQALNYLDQYGEAPIDIAFLMHMPYYSYRCGSTILAVWYTLITLSSLSILFLPSILLKVIGCIFSSVVVFFLWIFDKLNFFQFFVVKEPSMAEIELAYIGLKEYVKELKVGEEHEKVR